MLFRKIIQDMFDGLPHDYRRRLYAKVRPRNYQMLREQRVNYLRKVEELGCLFVHVPKAAGTSVVKALFGQSSIGHYALKQYQIMYEYAEYSGLFKFAFVRNPWDRVYSAYRFLRKGGANHADRKWAERHLSEYKGFEDFVLNGLDQITVQNKLHFIPQYKMLSDKEDSEWVGVDFLGFYENLEEDFRVVADIVYPEDQVQLPHENKTERGKSYLSVYTDLMRGRVANIYSRDIEMFGYCFDNSTLRTQLGLRDKFSRTGHLQFG